MSNFTDSVKDPETALQTTAEDWIVKYHADAGPALAQLVNFVIRVSLVTLHPLSSLIFLTRLHLEYSCSPFQTCGCNGTVDEDVAQDLDAIVDSLDDLQEDFKKVGFFPSRMYALVFRLRKLFLTFFASL